MMSGDTLNRIAGGIFSVLAGVGLWLGWEAVLEGSSIYPELCGGLLLAGGVLGAIFDPHYGEPL